MLPIEFIKKAKGFIASKIDVIAKSNPMINFTQPFMMKIIDNKTGKISKFLEILSDDNGQLDVDGLLTDVIQRLSSVDPFIIDLMSITKVEIGGGKIKLDLPLTNKAIVFSTHDLQAFKDTLKEVLTEE